MISFSSGNMGKKIKSFVETLSEIHQAIRLFVKPADSHQYLHSSSCQPYHCKKGVTYSQAFRLN